MMRQRDLAAHSVAKDKWPHRILQDLLGRHRNTNTNVTKKYTWWAATIENQIHKKTQKEFQYICNSHDIRQGTKSRKISKKWTLRIYHPLIFWPSSNLFWLGSLICGRQRLCWLERGKIQMHIFRPTFQPFRSTNAPLCPLIHSFNSRVAALPRKNITLKSKKKIPQKSHKAVFPSFIGHTFVHKLPLSDAAVEI